MRHHRRWGAALALVAGLLVGGGTVAHAEPSPPPVDVVSSPESQLRIADRYLRANDAKRVGWDELIDDGRRLPEPTKACERSWSASGKDRRIDWSSASHLCMSGLLGGAYKPQGVGGSATTEHYQIAGLPAAERNLVLTSWYSRSAERGLFAANGAGESVTRLVVMDMDQSRYNTVELVRPGANGKLHNLNSHGSGLVWAGQYLYSSSHSELWMYNADDILKVDGRYVLPAVGRWRVTGLGGLSSLSLDQSTVPTRLVGIDYSKAGQATLQSFDLAAPDGRLADGPGPTGQDLVLANTLGEEGRVVRSSSSETIPGSSFQGIARYGPYTFANSSALHYGGRVADATVVMRDGQVTDRFRMPHGNGQSIYIDYLRGNYVSVTEAGSQFMYQLPLNQLVGTDSIPPVEE